MRALSINIKSGYAVTGSGRRMADGGRGGFTAQKGQGVAARSSLGRTDGNGRGKNTTSGGMLEAAGTGGVTSCTFTLVRAT